MTAAQVMDVMARLPGCAGRAADAISAYTQVKMEDAPSVFKIPKSECPDIWIRLVWKIQSCLLSELCTAILWKDYYERGNSRKFYWNTDGKKFQIENAFSFTEKKGLFLSEYVDDKSGWKETKH